jgi:L-fucose mutarotase/ribose pyranase (RbsD/FucU family)
LLAATFALTLAGCKTATPNPTGWESTVIERLPILGHRNWILVADSAYPAQVTPGVQTINTSESQLDVLRTVLKQIKAVGHVTPVIRLDTELESVSEKAAPGVSEYRDKLARMLKGYRVERLPHEQLIKRLDEAGKTFQVLVLKSDLKLPYTSVFLELDCGYWSPEKEAELRNSLR